MKINMGLDTGENGKNKIVIVVNTPLLPKHFEDFKHLIEENERNLNGLPPNLKVLESGDNNNEAIITFPIDRKPLDTSEPDRKAVKLDTKQIDTLNVALNLWVSLALRQEISSVEFIPLHGYSMDDLKEDIQEAVAHKRDLCIIRTYKEYLDSQNAKNAKDAFTFVQYRIKYGSDEYSNVAIALYNKELKDLREAYEDKLTLTEWI